MRVTDAIQMASFYANPECYLNSRNAFMPGGNLGDEAFFTETTKKRDWCVWFSEQMTSDW